MINLEITYFLLSAHFLGDFHFQSPALAEEKQANAVALLKHLGIHALILLPVFFIYFERQVFVLICLILSGHLVIDGVKLLINRQFELKEDTRKILFVLDQVLHLALIFLLSEHLFSVSGPIFNNAFPNWLLLLITVTKPANVSFKVLFSHYQNFHPPLSGSQTVPGAGTTIGNLERILSAIFLSLNSLASIGLIYTAKSIARFKEIESNRGFAEYYLIGTLYSILYVLVVYLAVF